MPKPPRIPWAAISRSSGSNLTIGATVASNAIHSDVQAYIRDSTDVETIGGGSIELEALQDSEITAYAVAASIAVSTGETP